MKHGRGAYRARHGPRHAINRPGGSRAGAPACTAQRQRLGLLCRCRIAAILAIRLLRRHTALQTV